MSENIEKMLFIIPGFFYIEDYQKLLYYNDIPLGTLQLSSYLRHKMNINTNIIDLRVEQEKYPNLAINEPNNDKFMHSFLQCLEKNEIQEYESIGINCYTSYQYSQTDFIAHIIREEFPDKTLIVGGYHPTAVPEDFTYNNSPFDFVIIGEAELILLELLNSKISKKGVQNKTRVLNSNVCINLNHLPFPDYELFLEKYPYNDRFQFEIYNSRGCPYQCSFCAKNYEFRSFNFNQFKENFEKLCKIIEEFNIKYQKIVFADQSFDRLLIREKILDYILVNKFHERFTFSCQSRVETIDNNFELIKKYQKCNMVVGYGLETVNPLILKEMHKTDNPKKYIEIVKNIIKNYKNNGDIYCRLNILVGFPGETNDSFHDSVDFINKNAIHPNIQISPTLFSNYPNVFVYQNMDYYKNKFGSEFLKEWWKVKSNPFKSSVPEKTSKSYTKKQLIGDYKDNYFEILKNWKDKIFTELIYWKTFFNNWYKEL